MKTESLKYFVYKLWFIWCIWINHGVTHVCYTSSLSILMHMSTCWVPHTCLCSCTSAHTHLEHIYTFNHQIFFRLQHICNCEPESSKAAFKYADGDVSETYSFDISFLCSLQGRNTHCFSYTDLHFYKEDCKQLKHTTILSCEDIRRHCNLNQIQLALGNIAHLVNNYANINCSDSKD